MLTESIVEEANLEWFGELRYAVGFGRDLAPGEPGSERDTSSEVVLLGRLGKAIRCRSLVISSAHSLAIGKA